jgi:hypothetical protein
MPPVGLSKEESETHAKRPELVFMSDEGDASSQESLQDSVLPAFQREQQRKTELDNPIAPKISRSLPLGGDSTEASKFNLQDETDAALPHIVSAPEGLSPQLPPPCQFRRDPVGSYHLSLVFDFNHLEPTPLPPQFDHAPMSMVPCPIVERRICYAVVEKVLYYVHSS